MPLFNLLPNDANPIESPEPPEEPRVIGNADKIKETPYRKALEYVHGLHMGKENEVRTCRRVFQEVGNHVSTILMSPRRNQTRTGTDSYSAKSIVGWKSNSKVRINPTFTPTSERPTIIMGNVALNVFERTKGLESSDSSFKPTEETLKHFPALSLQDIGS